MNFEARLEQLKKLIVAAGREINGEDRFQMLAYLCQTAGDNLSQDFSFEYYEVTSASLSKDLDKAASEGLITRNSNEKFVEFSVPEDLSDEVEGPGFKIVSEISRCPIETLDVLSTIIYLHRVGYKDDKLGDKILQLKERHKEVFEEATNLAKTWFSIDCKLSAGVSL